MLHADTPSYYSIHKDAMSTNIRVKRICEFCGNSFVAKTTVTRYCSHQCNSRAYKAKVNGKKVEASDLQTLTAILSPLEVLKAKEYLSISEACTLMGVSRMTLHRHIKKGKLKTGSIGNRVIIRKKDIDSIFV